MQAIGNQLTAETWELAGDLINSQKMGVMFKSENGVYYAVDASYSTVIVNGTTEYVVLSGEMLDPQPNV